MRTKVRAQRQLLASFREEMRLSKEKKNPQEVEDKERSIAASATRNSSLSAPVLFQMGKEEANAVEDEIVSLYPADNAVVRFYRMGIKGNKEQHRWASVSKDGKRDNEEEGGVGRWYLTHCCMLGFFFFLLSFFMSTTFSLLFRAHVWFASSFVCCARPSGFGGGGERRGGRW
jgi:hypothetical protein